MHMFAVVLVKDSDDIAGEVERLMAPHLERYESSDDDARPSGWWDWYRIGGRWDGIIRGRNRHDGCPGCTRGHDCHYSPEHEQITHNIVPVREMGEVKPYTIVTPDGEAFHRSTWDGEQFIEDTRWDETADRLFLAHRDHIAVGVDYHD